MNNKEDLNIILNSIGFGFPQSSEEIGLFKEIHKNYPFKSRPEVINGKNINLLKK